MMLVAFRRWWKQLQHFSTKLKDDGRNLCQHLFATENTGGLESARAALCKWSPCTRQTFPQTLLQTRQTNIHSAELKSYFRPWKLNSPFSVSQSIQLHIRVLVPIPCHRCEKAARESRNFHHLTTQRDNIRAETHDMCVDLRGYMSSGWRDRFLLKIEKLSHIIGMRLSSWLWLLHFRHIWMC